MAEGTGAIRENTRHSGRFRRIAGIAALAIVVLLGVALAVVHTTSVRRYVLDRVTSLLAAQNIELSTDELSYNLFDLSLGLTNIRVRGDALPDAPPFATIGRAQVDLSLLQLLRGRYVVESATLDAVRVHYFVAADGTDNLPRPVRTADEPSEPLDYLVDWLTTANAEVRYEDRARQIDVTLPVTSLEVDGNPLTSRHAVTLALAATTAQVQERRVQVDQLAGRFDLGDDDVEIEELSASGEGATIRVSGTLAPFAAPVADLTIHLTADAARAATLAGSGEPIAGTVTAEARVRGPVASPTVEATLGARDLVVRDLGPSTLDASATYDAAASAATIRALELRAPFGSLRVSGDVALEANRTSRLRATIDGLDVAPLMRALRLEMVAATRVDANVDASWPGLRYEEAVGSAGATLVPTAARASRGVIPVGGRIDVDARGGGISATVRQISAANTVLTGRVGLDTARRLRGTLQARTTNATRTATDVELLLGRAPGSLLPTPVTGAITITADLSGQIDAPTARARIAAPQLTVGTLDGVRVNGEVAYTPDAVSIDRLDAGWRESELRAQGRIGLTGRQDLALTFTTNTLDIPALAAAANAGDLPVAGTLILAGTVNGTLQQPLATVTAEGAGLVAYAETLGTLSARVELAGREVFLRDLRLVKPQPSGDGTLTASGAYHLDSERYSVTVASRNLQLLALTLPDGRGVRGVVRLDGSGTGTISAPAGELRASVDGLQLAEYALGEVTVRVTAADRRAVIAAAAPKFRITLDGTIATDAPYAATIAARADDLDFAELPVELQTPLEGRVRATVNATGNLQDVKSFRGEATVAAFSGEWNQQPFAIDGPARFRYADERLVIDALTVTARDSRVELSGELPLTSTAGEGALQLTATANLATLAQYAPADMPVSGDGSLTIAGTIRGTLERIDPDLSIAIDNGLLVAPNLEPGLSRVQLRARVAEGAADISQLSAAWGAATITASGRVPFGLLPDLPVQIPREQGAATFTAALRNLDPAVVPGAPAGVTGRLSADVAVTGARADVAALEGQLTFPELMVAFNGLTLEQQQPSVVALSGGVVRIERLALSGTAGTLTASGTVGLLGAQPLDATVNGTINTGALTVLTDAARAEGDLTLQLVARGTVSEPDVNGTLALADAAVFIDEPAVAAENLSARIAVAGRRITLESLAADVNGGRLSGTGGVTIGDNGLDDLSLDVTADDVALDAPLDLRSLSDARLRITRQGDDFVLGGTVTIEEAGLTGDINFDTGILAAINTPRTLDLTTERNELVERLRFNVQVLTQSPILVDNNLARAEVTANVRVLGSAYDTGLSGQIEVLEGGEITLNERRYTVNRGVISFVDERRIFPSFDLQLATTAGAYDITLGVSGTPGDTETSLTSDPVLPEPDIMAILVTGRTLDEMRGQEYDVAREQVLSYLAGRVGSSLGRGLERATGLSQVRIEPNLIANETDPSARLTVGQELTDDLEFVYSTNLTDSNDQIWVAQYDITRRFQTQATRQSDNSYRFDFRHDVRFGGMPEPRRQPRQRPVLEALSITGDQPLPFEEMTRLIGLQQGKPFDYFALRDGIAKLESRLRDAGWLQSRVRFRREGDAAAVRVAITVTSGPRVTITFAGRDVPKRVQEDVRLQWHRGVFDAQRIDDGVERLRAWLMTQQHLQPTVTAAVNDSGETRQVTFQLTPGPRYSRVVVAFEGAVAVTPKVLNDIIDDQHLEQELFTDPLVVTTLLQKYYREQGYLAVSIDTPRYEFTGPSARVVLDVEEGPRFMVRQVGSAGNVVFDTATLLRELPVVAGDPFLPFAAENALARIRDLYWRRGYNDVRPDYDLVINRDLGEVDVTFRIREGAQSVIAGVEISGTERTSERLVREQLALPASGPLDLATLSRSRQNLYGTGAFSVVDVTREPVVASAAAESDGRVVPSDTDGIQPVQIRVNVREVQPFQLRYGASYDTERGVGGIFDVSNHNSLGKARVVGLRSRYDADLREARLYMSQPSLRYFPVKLTGSVYYREERNQATELSEPFNIDRKGVSVQGETELASSYIWTYGYRYERVRTFEPIAGGLDDTLTVAPLTSTFTREARDEALDATRGSFTSHAFSYSPSWLGSGQPFLKYFGQYFHYIPLQPETRERFTNEILRPRLVFATGVRLGLARGIGGEMPLSERFFAGGSTTLRGFAQNVAGPIAADGLPLGGSAMFVLNNELRAPLFGRFDGVAFLDIGNVFVRVEDFSLTDLRKSAGLGLRVRTPWFLLRGDYGVVLDPRVGERRGRFYFSIGQAY